MQLFWIREKTTPAWRVLEKYAVRCGGAQNHRMGLYDAILVKDNHLAAYAKEETGSASRICSRKRRTWIQPRNSWKSKRILSIRACQILDIPGVDVILLDNFSLDDMRAAVELRDKKNLKGKLKLEASGGVNLGYGCGCSQDRCGLHFGRGVDPLGGCFGFVIGTN